MKRRSLLVGGASLVALGEGLPAMASAAPAEPGGPPATAGFASSFEPGEPALDWTSTAETDAAGHKRMSGVTGRSSSQLPGSISTLITAVTASAENPPAEVAANLNDGDVNSKWLAFAPTGWVRVALSEPVAVVAYALTSANDVAGRDPKDWTLQGSPDGTTWTNLDAQQGQSFAHRYQMRRFDVVNTTKYQHYQLVINANAGDDVLQLAELQLSNGDTAPPPAEDMKTFVSAGPVNGPNMLPHAGFTGLAALEYSGQQTVDGRGYAYNKLFDVDLTMQRDTVLAYKIFPELTAGDLAYPSTYVALDLAFADGTYLSELVAASDEHGARLSPDGQGAGKILYADQWNAVRCRVGDVAAGRRVTRILLGYDNPHGPALFHGWIDDVTIGRPAPDTRRRPTDYVVTTRGTNSSGDFSRGNNFPATALPNGFNFWTPVTDAGSLSWLYSYQADNNAANLPTLQAFAVSHEPSPWMGERQTFQVMPSAADDTPDADRAHRALAFRHDHEIARAHYYSVMFDNGIRTELTPTDHAAVFRFTFPGEHANLIVDNVTNDGGLTLDAEHRTLTGYSDVNLDGWHAGASRLYVYATFDRAVTASGKLPGGGGADVTGYLRFDAGADRQVTMRIATSLIGLDQARRNLALEIGAHDGFDAVRDRAERAWHERLRVVEVDGATPDQLTTLYSNLYRLNLYPNSGFENTGSARKPTYRHASPVAEPVGESTPTRTGAKVVDGKIYVNNGFWDTYRTAWPAYSLLYPRVAGELISGFVQQYLDGGWIARWSAPGYADLMTGTSSDVAFADAFLKGVKGFDAAAAYQAAVRNATVAPPNAAVGRKGLATSIFLGYTPDSTDESVSWALEGFLNDFGIGNMAAELARRARPGSAARRRYREESGYFLNRARDYVHLFDPAVGFFQGFDAAGRPRLSPADYDPRVWGNDYTETDGWNFAFHVAHDGQGLANLYGGRGRLAAKLDTFFSTPETAQYPGSYGGTIHEMLEARDVRMGQYGHSNQPSHHIAYMYTYVGAPSRTQQKVREVLRRLYVGSEIGQGYCGDEDNGEMSAWWLFSALGIYPLQMGSPRYAIGSPLFRRAVLHLANGRDLVVTARDNSTANVYVQSLHRNGRPHDRVYLTHDELTAGGRLDFQMGPHPSTWGTGSAAAPPSLTTGNAIARPLADITTATAAGAAATPVAATDTDRPAAAAAGDGAGDGTAPAGGGAGAARHGASAAAATPATAAATAAAADAAAAGDGTDLTALFDNTSTSSVTFDSATPSISYQLPHPARVQYYTLTSGTGHDDPAAWTLSGSSDGTHWTVLDRRAAETFPWRAQTRPFAVEHPGAYRQYRLDITASTAATVTLAELELLA